MKGISIMKRAYICAGVLLLVVGSAFAEKQTLIPGQQTMVARRTHKPVVIDGVLNPAEWSAAIPVHVNAVKPGEAPGLVPMVDWGVGPMPLSPPRNQDDCSYTIRAMYDDNYLYVAVDVADDIIKTGNPAILWLDDVVELYIDGDQKSPDDWANGIAYQIDTSAVGTTDLYWFGYPEPLGVNYTSAAGLRPRGYLVEARISLDSIQMSNGGKPELGSKIGFNVTVGDNDTGLVGDPWFWGWSVVDDGYYHIPNPETTGIPFDPTNWFKNTPSSYLAWDGSYENWAYSNASNWGTLYFAP